MERPRKLVLTDWTQANNALIRYFEGNKSKLAEHVKMSRTTVTNFFGEKPIRESEFRNLCLALRLNWEAVSSVHTIAPPSNPSKPDDAPIEQVREHCRQKILNQHSRMRLLSGEEIGVDQLYVDVWLLNRSPRTFQVSPNKLLKTFDLRNDRLGLGDRIRRNPGFEVANVNPKLVILGKPGSGKTTFLKHLAVDWCKGEFQPDLITVLIELRRIQDREWNLLDRIDKELRLGNWNQVTSLKHRITELEQQINNSLSTQVREKDHSIQERQKIEIERLQKQLEELRQQLEKLPLYSLLKQGKLLVLMDGLDEVPTSQLRCDVQNQLQQITEEYPNNRLIMTCRTQVMESIPIGFTSVEVADFSDEQVKQFVQNWFTANGQSSAAAVRQQKMFNNAINHNKALRELTMTPVLLSLMCLVLQDEGEIPSQTDWLYQKGVKLLLSKWNSAKQIDGWEVGSETYQQLSVEQKEILLTEIAARKFENPENFVLFQQEEIATQITQFLRLANPREGIGILKAIEAQHGLLIERADELWSFSHLTFQEYFTVQWLTQLPSEQLAEKIANRQWQEAVKQIVKSQQPADRLLRLIKQASDQSIANEPKLQNFLIWVLQKSESIQANHKSAAIRFFYFVLVRALELALTLALALALARDLAHAIRVAHALVRALDYDHERARNFARIRTHDLDLARALSFARTLDSSSTTPDLEARPLNLALVHTLDLALAFDLNLNLASKLEQLRTVLAALETWESFQQWWQVHGTQWIEQLRQIMINHYDIGHNWQLTNAQIQQLQRYYDANKFLIELMQIEGAVSDSVRAEIEDSLLLPWEELQRRQS